MGGQEMVCIERTSSIENEPRTLNLGQIDFAREAALYVVHTRGVEEAMRIFTQGLEPVVSCARDNNNNNNNNEDTRRGVMDFSEKTDLPSSEDHLNLQEVRDIATAPF